MCPSSAKQSIKDYSQCFAYSVTINDDSDDDTDGFNENATGYPNTFNGDCGKSHQIETGWMFSDKLNLCYPRVNYDATIPRDESIEPARDMLNVDKKTATT